MTVFADRERMSVMRFMLNQTYGRGTADSVPVTEWSPDDLAAHIEFQTVLNEELMALGELVDAQGLAGPDAAKFVVWDGQSAPVVTDGPFSEFKELIAGYRLIDVDSLDRALEIAARISSAPGAAGAPVGQPIEVRQVLTLEGTDE
jgi:hypothetical protein